MGFPQTQGWTIAHQDPVNLHTSHIAELPPYIGNQDNAVLIVRAVNEYDALLAVAEAASRILAEKCAQGNTQGLNTVSAENQLESALSTLSKLRKGKS